jgi:hypothetical protein
MVSAGIDGVFAGTSFPCISPRDSRAAGCTPPAQASCSGAAAASRVSEFDGTVRGAGSSTLELEGELDSPREGCTNSSLLAARLPATGEASVNWFPTVGGADVALSWSVSSSSSILRTAGGRSSSGSGTTGSWIRPRDRRALIGGSLFDAAGESFRGRAVGIGGGSGAACEGEAVASSS